MGEAGNYTDDWRMSNKEIRKQLKIICFSFWFWFCLVIVLFILVVVLFVCGFVGDAGKVVVVV